MFDNPQFGHKTVTQVSTQLPGRWYEYTYVDMHSTTFYIIIIILT